MPQGIVSNIDVQELFGKFSYNIPTESVMRSPAILYGDNGVGKSTILNLTFHMLSSAPDRGHRTAIHRIPFKSIKIHLSNGYKVSADRSESYEDDGLICFGVWRGGELIAEWNHSANKQSRYELDPNSVKDLADRVFNTAWLDSAALARLKLNKSDERTRRGEKEYLSALDSCVPAMFYLNADRKLEGDSVSDPGDDLELRQIIAQRELKRIPDILQASRGISLKQALNVASRWVTKRAVRSSNQGAENVHSVYQKIIGELANNYNSEELSEDKKAIGELLEEIKKIETDSKSFSAYELTSELPMDKFRGALSAETDRAVGISARLIAPYAKSLGSRLEAIRPLYDVLNSFVTIVNSFLSRKQISFSMSQGFFIRDERGNILEAAQLSSGEQQLLLIFANVLAARDKPSVFIIDEPEISLNIKWQRMIVDSLLKLAEGSEIQYILASHSIELLSQHENSVIQVG